MSKSGKSRSLLFIVLFLVVAAAAAGSYTYWKGRKETPPEIGTTTVGRGDVVQAVTATGDLQPETTIDVSSQISGLIKEVLVDYNTKVTKDQILAQLDPATYDQRLRQAEADLASSQANFTLVRLNTDRVQELHTKNLVSQQEVDQASAQLAQAKAQLMTRQASVDDAKVTLSRCTIRAPIDGIVISRQAEPGKTVAASLNAPTLFVIVNDLTRMEINAAVAEADIGNVELDQAVNFTVDAFPGRQFRGRVTQIRNSPKTNQNVVTYETIITVRNDDLKLKPGMTANVSIVVAQHPGVLRLPNSALRVRIPDQLTASMVVEPAPVAAPKQPDGAGAAALRPATDEERRAIMREAGFTPSSGPPTPEIMEKVQALAKEKGIDPASLRRTRGGPGQGGGERASSGAPNTPTTRTVYRVLSNDPKMPKVEPVTVKLGISDGTTTEVLEGLKEGDTILTSVYLAGATGSAAPASNPFSGNRSPFGGPGGGGRR
jgi:HlyD family secretion protein